MLHSIRQRLPKSLRSDHNTVDKNSTEQSIAQCQHPAEGTHIHAAEQVRPRNERNNGQNTEIRHNNNNCRKTLPNNTMATIQRAIPVEKHNYPYQIK